MYSTEGHIPSEQVQVMGLDVGVWSRYMIGGDGHILMRNAFLDFCASVLVEMHFIQYRFA